MSKKTFNATDNLISLANRTTEEQREIAILGGIKSGEVRRNKRDLRRALETILETDITLPDGTVKSGAEAIAYSLFEKALKGDTRAFEIIRDTCAQKVPDKFLISEINPEIAEEVEQLVSEIGEECRRELNDE
jgi:hypothetical protein